MASNKEALVLLVDVGDGMSEAAPGFDSPLQVASDILQMIVQRKMFQESKDELALILYGTEESQNELADESNYQHISVMFPLGPANWRLFEQIEKVQAGHHPADMIDALVIAADHLRRETDGKRGFAAKRILLFTNATTTFNENSLQVIVDSLRRNDIIVDAIGPNWNQQEDDELSSTSGETNGHQTDEEEPTASARPTTSNDHPTIPKKPLTEEQKTNIRTIKKVVDQTEGSLFTYREALAILTVHQSKVVKPTATKYVMQLAELKLHICTYIQVKENKPGIFRLKKVYARDPTTEIKVDRGRYTKDEQDQEIEKDELTDGFRYGSTFVPMSKEALEDMKYQSEKCFSVVGFSDSRRLRRSLYLGDTVYEVIAEPQYEEETQAFAALVQAMYDTDTVAIVRRCFSDRSSPELGFLRPHITHDHICMYYIKLPFAEDLREFDFDNLDALKRNQPSEEQLQSVDQLITTMDLTHSEADGEEALKPESISNPYIQRMFQSIARRAVTPDEPLSLSNSLMEMNDELIQSIARKSKRSLDAVQSQFTVRDTGKRQKITTGGDLFGSGDFTNKGSHSEENATFEEPVTDSTSFEAQTASIKKSTVKSIGTVTPVEDFKTLIEQGTLSLTEICKQMTNLIVQLIDNSHGDALFDKILQCLHCLRDVCIRKLEPKIFNDLQHSIKKQTSAADGRKDFWKRLLDEKINLITSDECIESNVLPIEAEKFFEEQPIPIDSNNPDQALDEEDLFDLI